MNYEFELDLSSLKINKKSKKESLVTIIINCNNKTKKQINDSLLFACNQTFENIEIILININKNILKRETEIDKRIIIISDEIENVDQVKKFTSKKSKFITYLDAGEIIDKTYIETNLLSLELKNECLISFTDTINLKEKKAYNYIFENKILLDYKIPVPNLFFNKEIIDKIGNIKLDEIRTWKRTSELTNEYTTIHQSYYGFITDKSKSDLQDDNYLYIERNIFLSDILSYPFDNYYHDIIKSNISKLSVYPKKKEKKNILMIIPWMVIGGADYFNLDFVRLIDKSKYEITIITDHPKEYVLRQKFEKYTESVMEMASFLDRKDWPTFIEYIIETRNIDLIIISNSTTGYNMIPYIKLKYPNIPIIDYIHSVELYNRSGGYGRDSIMMKSLIDKTLFCSKNAEDSFHDLFDTSGTKTETIYIGVDSDKFKPSNRLSKQSREKYHVNNSINIGYICRTDYPKRPLLLAEIIKKEISNNENVKFIIGGDGPLLKNLKSKINEYGLEDKVLFLGIVTNSVEFYSLCDITINCSIKEGLALTAYESLAMGIPVVSADVGGHRELIDNSCGIIVPLLQKEEEIRHYVYTDEEIDNYVKAIEKVIKSLNKYKKNCRNRIINHFSLNHMIKNMEMNIEEVICNKNQEVIENSKKLKYNENIVYEYINHYLMGNEYEYKTLINKYYVTFEVKEEVESEETKKEDKVIIKIIKKMHIYSEYLLVKESLINFIKIILFPLRLLIIEIKKIIKLLGGKDGK